MHYKLLHFIDVYYIIINVTENIYEWIRKIDKFSIATQFLNRRNVAPNVEIGIYK